jgi:uncharacterized protein YbjT (DUF2867 family)
LKKPTRTDEVRPLRVAIWGATGATGSELLRQCVRDPRIGEITAFLRRPLDAAVPSVTQVMLRDFLDLDAVQDALNGLDVAYWCLGVSQSAVPDEERYREITHAYALTAARALLANSPQAAFHFVSGWGADPTGRSRMMWARVKGQTELDLQTVGLSRVTIWRPGYIHVVGGRKAPLLADRLAWLVSPLLRIIPGVANTTINIAHAMLHVADGEGRSGPVGPREIDRLARAYRAASSNRTG